MASVTNRSNQTQLSPRSGNLQHLQRRGVAGRLTGVQILATGSYVPPTEVSNDELAALGCDAEWIEQRTGILSRHRAADGVSTSDLAVQAARNCLDAAGVSGQQLDLILVGTVTPDYPTPSTACLLQRELGSTAAAMDLNAACAGFMYGLVTGMQFVAGGACQRVLVVGAEILSRIANPQDKHTTPLFGDAAGAVLLGPADEETGLLSYQLGADGTRAELLCMPAGGSREPLTAERLAQGRQYLNMDGRGVFKWAVRLLQDAATDVLAAADLTIQDIDLAVFHQANIRILDAAAEALQLRPEQMVVNLQRYGNTSAASIPLALDELVRQDRVQDGAQLLLAGFGAGLAWGAGVLRW